MLIQLLLTELDQKQLISLHQVHRAVLYQLHRTTLYQLHITAPARQHLTVHILHCTWMGLKRWVRAAGPGGFIV